MLSIIESIFITIEALASIIAIWGNGFIVLVIGAEWVKTKKISWYDFLFLNFGISKIGMICTVMEDSIRVVFYPEIYGDDRIVSVIIDFLKNLSNSFNTWCTTCLGIFYFFKLSSFSHPLFLWLKWRRDKIFLVIRLGFLLSLICNIMSIKYGHIWVSEYFKMEINVTWQEWRHQKQYFREHILLNLGSFISLTLSFISFFLLTFSLARHVRRMMHHANGSGDTNTEIPVRARNTMVSFLILLIIHYVTTFLIIWIYATMENLIGVLVIETLIAFYSSVHSFTMIQGNRKLKQSFVSLGKKLNFASREYSSS